MVWFRGTGAGDGKLPHERQVLVNLGPLPKKQFEATQNCR